MSGKEFLFIIGFPAIVTLITLVTVLSMQWMLEKEVNQKQPVFLFHVFNLIFMMMMYGTTSIIFHGMFLDGIQDKGWFTVSLYAYIYPLPFLLLIYSIASPIFRIFIQPYRIKKGTNIVYLKGKRRNG